MELFVAVVSGLITALLLWWWRSSKSRKSPPGPWGLPIVGYLPFLTSKPYLTFTRLAKHYGNVFTVRLGSLNMLILNDFRSTKDAFARDAFIGRPPEVPFVVSEETIETGAMFGLPWKEQRRLSLHMLRDLGLGKSKIEGQIQEEINEVLEHFEENVDKPFCMKDVLHSSMSNNVASLMFGKRLKYDDPVRQKMNKTTNTAAMLAGQATWTIFFPWIKKILQFFGIGSIQRMSKQIREMKHYFMKEINEHEKTLDPNNIRDFIDGYLLEIKKRENDPTFTKKILEDLVGTFFGAGSETVRASVEWLVLMAASDQKAQRRIQEEIHEVVGENRLPVWPDIQKMPYTNAFIMEMMRWRTLIPINLLRYVRLGSLNMLILNDFQSTKDAFARDAFIGRPPEIPFVLNKETIETGAMFGLPWKEQRRLSLHMLRDLGLGKSKIEGQIQEEINEVLEHFEKNVDKPYCMKDVLHSSMSNNVASLMFGKRLKYDDPVRQRMNKIMNSASMLAGQAAWIIFFPWIKKILQLFGTGGMERMSKQIGEMKNYFMNEINEHEKTLDPNTIRDFIDGYLLEIKKRENDPIFTKKILQDLVLAFFGAGSETVRGSVEWLVLMAASDQEAQRRIQEEIHEVVGENRLPVWPDNQKMPYTNAFIMEMSRWKTLTPLNLLRYTIADTELNGYFIPKHTRVLSNHWAIHHDPEYWGTDAEEFRPERFLTDDGKEVKKWERYVPFSIGKRSCPGEPMAKIEIFLYFVSILQRFEVRLPEGKAADFEGVLGIGLNPKPQDLVLTKRN